MEVKAKHYYENKVEDVFACFGDAEKITQKLEKMGARNINIKKCELSESALSLDIDREMPTDAPSMFKKFVNEWSEVKQNESWSGTPGESYTGKFTIELHGVPVSIKGVCQLSAYDQGALNDVTVTVHCGIPLIGKKLEKFIGENIQEAMETEFQIIKASL